MIDLGEIRTGQLFEDNVLTLQNIGQKEVRLVVSRTLTKQKFVKSAAFQGSPAQAQPIPIIPSRSQTFSVKIDIDVFDSQFDSEIINTEGKLGNRSIHIISIGHTSPMPTLTTPSNSAPDTWSVFRLLPAGWLLHISRQHSILSAYASLVTLAAVAHVCGSDQINLPLPIEKEQWEKVCTELAVASRRPEHNKRRKRWQRTSGRHWVVIVPSFTIDICSIARPQRSTRFVFNFST